MSLIVSMSYIPGWDNQPIWDITGSVSGSFVFPNYFTGSTYFNTLSSSVYLYNGTKFLQIWTGDNVIGTASYSSTASFVLNNGFNGINNAANFRVLFSDGTTNAATASTYLIVTQSNNQNGISVGIGTTNTSNEGNLFLGARSTNEGGQLFLQKATNYGTASMLDNYQDYFRILKGNDTGSNAVDLQINHSNGQLHLPNYNSTSSFTGTPIDFLSFDSNGRVLTSPSKYRQSIGNTVQLSFNITHSLGDSDVQVNIRNNSTGQIYYPSATAGAPPQYTATVSDSNTVVIAFTSAPSANQYTVVISK